MQTNSRCRTLTISLINIHQFICSAAKTYLFAVGRGATFVNDYVAGSRDELIGRMAGVFTYGGEMRPDRKVSQVVPAFLVNACGVAVQM